MSGKSTTTSSVAVHCNVNSVLRPKLAAIAFYNEQCQLVVFALHTYLTGSLATSVFLPRNAMLAQYMPSLCVSVCVCVCLPHSGIASKRLKV